MALDSSNRHLQHEEEDENEVDSSGLSAMLMSCSQVYSAVLKAAVELNLFEIIAKAKGSHVSASEVASQLPSSMQHEDLSFRIDRMLRLLASHSLLTSSYRASENGDTERVYGISAVGKYFVGGDDHNGADLGALSSFICHPALVDAW